MNKGHIYLVGRLPIKPTNCSNHYSIYHRHKNCKLDISCFQEPSLRAVLFSIPPAGHLAGQGARPEGGLLQAELVQPGHLHLRRCPLLSGRFECLDSTDLARKNQGGSKKIFGILEAIFNWSS